MWTTALWTAALLAAIGCAPTGDPLIDADPLADADPTDAQLTDAGLGDVDPPPQGAWRAAGDDFPAPCGSDDAPEAERRLNGPLWDGPLCGPGRAPCALIIDEPIDPALHFRNDAPGLAIAGDGAIEVVYSVAEGSDRGWRATRGSDGGWSHHALEPAVATASVAAGPEGRFWAVAYGGAPQVEALLSWVSGAPAAAIEGHGPIPGGDVVGPAAVAVDGGGCVHVATLPTSVDGPRGLGWARYDGADWRTASLPGNTSSAVTVQVAGAGHVHLALRMFDPDGSWVTWTLPSGDGAGRPVERVFPVRGTLVSRQVHLAVEPGDGTQPPGVPHVLSDDGDGLSYAVRTGPGVWRVLKVARSQALGDVGCRPGAPAAGGTCVVHDVTASPLGLVASRGGDVRLVWAEAHVEATLVVQPSDNPRLDGEWGHGPDGATLYTDLVIGAVIDGALRSGPPLTVDGQIIHGRVVLGPDGDLHLAAYRELDLSHDTDARYLRIGPER